MQRALGELRQTLKAPRAMRMLVSHNSPMGALALVCDEISVASRRIEEFLYETFYSA